MILEHLATVVDREGAFEALTDLDLERFNAWMTALFIFASSNAPLSPMA